ncbi:hypothetical protein, partial [Vibrio cholerae]|uniref:hypothetical protein n=1 Tax=Vibrio cholerae TaxID=666 RepID=UPI001C2FB987
MAFLLCVGFCGYGVVLKLGSGVGCPLTGRCAAVAKNNYHRIKLRSKIRSDFDAYMVFYETSFSELLCKY